MSNTNFEAILAEEPLIEDLINNHQVNIFSNYPECPEYSKEFLDWISPKYFKAFKAILRESTNSNKSGKLSAFLKTPSYCDTKTKEEINQFLLEFVLENNRKNKSYLEDLNKNTLRINEIYNVGGFRVVTPTTVSILNDLSHPDIGTLQSDTIALASQILEKIAGADKITTIEKVLIRQNLEQINKLQLSDSQKRDFPDPRDFEQSEFNFDKRMIWLIVSIVLILIKIALRMDRM